MPLKRVPESNARMRGKIIQTPFDNAATIIPTFSAKRLECGSLLPLCPLMPKLRQAGALQTLREFFCLLICVGTMFCMSLSAATPSITNLTMFGSAPQFSIASDVGATNQILCITDITQTNWTVLTNIVVSQSPYTFTDLVSSPSPQRFYRVAEMIGPTNTVTNTPVPPPGMSLIPAGVFEMGDAFYEGATYEIPIHSVYVSSFYMDKYEVSYALWSNVVAWSVTNGYSYDNPGAGKATNHPVQMVS